MKITKEIRDLSEIELQNRAAELKQELFNLRFQLAINQLENTNRIPEVKRDIARVMTILSEKKDA